MATALPTQPLLREPAADRLWLAIGISVALHAAVLSLNFAFPNASRQ
jgi:hypothetical protein